MAMGAAINMSAACYELRRVFFVFTAVSERGGKRGINRRRPEIRHNEEAGGKVSPGQFSCLNILDVRIL